MNSSCNNPPTAGFTFKGATNQWTIQAADFNLGRVSSGSTRCVGAIVGADLGLTSWVVSRILQDQIIDDTDSMKIDWRRFLEKHLRYF